MSTQLSETGLAKVEAADKPLAMVRAYFDLPAVRLNFEKMMGDREAAGFITEVLLVVANSDDLQKCSLPSIYMAALGVAAVRLSPSLGQAYIIPRKGRATWMPSYIGLQHLALRTGMYRDIHVSPVYLGEEPKFDRVTGRFQGFEGGPIDHKQTIVGWLAYMHYVPNPRGQHIEKHFYMTVQEIHDHARKYNKGGYEAKSGPWQSEIVDTVRAMEQKTVLRIMLKKWGYMTPSDRAAVEQAETEEVIDPEAEQLAEELTARDAEIAPLTEQPPQAATDAPAGAPMPPDPSDEDPTKLVHTDPITGEKRTVQGYSENDVIEAEADAKLKVDQKMTELGYDQWKPMAYMGTKACRLLAEKVPGWTQEQAMEALRDAKAANLIKQQVTPREIAAFAQMIVEAGSVEAALKPKKKGG